MSAHSLVKLMQPEWNCSHLQPQRKAPQLDLLQNTHIMNMFLLITGRLSKWPFVPQAKW